MTDDVRASYDAMAELYAALFLGELERDTNFQDWLARFASLATVQTGIVADVGCGPGQVVDHLSELGLNVIGYDLSRGQIAQAQKAFPDSTFHVGDLAAIDAADSSLGGIVSRYSIIHLLPARLCEVFVEWMRVLEPGAPVLVSFFGSTTADAHGTPFDHKVATAYELLPAAVADQLRDVGFTDIEVGVLPPPEGGRPFDQGTILTRKPEN
ncbi:MAG: class I SAM-dependent methyltransferase [Acidimicrobiales bacterium]